MTNNIAQVVRIFFAQDLLSVDLRRVETKILIPTINISFNQIFQDRSLFDSVFYIVS
jgi:hypothetical protein